MKYIHTRSSNDQSASKKIREECRPGEPMITFSYEHVIEIRLINPVPHNGHFTINYDLKYGESVGEVCAKIASKTGKLSFEFLISQKIFKVLQFLFNRD